MYGGGDSGLVLGRKVANNGARDGVRNSGPVHRLHNIVSVADNIAGRATTGSLVTARFYNIKSCIFSFLLGNDQDRSQERKKKLEIEQSWKVPNKKTENMDKIK